MLERLGRGDAAQRFPGHATEGPARGGDDEPGDLAVRARAQGLRDRRVLAVDRDEAGAGAPGGVADEGTALERRERRAESGGSGHGIEDDVGRPARDRLGGGLPQMNLTNGIIDSAVCGEFGQPFPHVVLTAGGRRGQPDDGDGEVERLGEQKVDLGPCGKADDCEIRCVLGQYVEGLSADRPGRPDYNDITFAHAYR